MKDVMEQRAAELEPFENRDSAWLSVLELHTPDNVQDKGMELVNSHDEMDCCWLMMACLLNERIDANLCCQEKKDASYCDVAVVAKSS